MKSCPTCHSKYSDEVAFCARDGASLVEAGLWSEGSVVRGKYRILAKVGQGGMGAVYKASHTAFEELRALKVINLEFAKDDLFVRRFKHEAVITRKLQHPNAVRVDDIDEAEDGRPFIVMEYIEGQNLKQLIQQCGHLPPRRVCRVARQVASALEAAHRLGMIHRDIKPANIVLVQTPDGEQAKVLDFGIAKLKEARAEGVAGLTLTGTGTVIGTAQYMSPEQAQGKHGDELDGRSDIYSLGIVMYQMLTGELPFKADTSLAMLIAHITTPPKPIREARPDLDIPEPIARIVMSCLEKNPDLRPSNAKVLQEELERAEQECARPTAAESLEATAVLQGVRQALQVQKVAEDSATEVREVGGSPLPVKTEQQRRAEEQAEAERRAREQAEQEERRRREEAEAARRAEEQAEAERRARREAGAVAVSPEEAEAAPSPEAGGAWRRWLAAAVLVVAVGGGAAWYVKRARTRNLSGKSAVVTPPPSSAEAAATSGGTPSAEPPVTPGSTTAPASGGPEAAGSPPRGTVESGASAPAAERVANRRRPSKPKKEAPAPAVAAAPPPPAPAPAPAPELTGPLTVHTTPGGAQVYLDGQLKGTTNAGGSLEIPPLAPGEHQLRVVLGGYGSREEKLTLLSGQSASISFGLQAAAPPAPAVMKPVRFAVAHKHTFGFCHGTLAIGDGRVSFRSDNPKHSFDAPVSDIKQWGSVKIGADFYLTLANNKTYYFTSESTSAVLQALQQAMNHH